jgi:hypothetical protein
MDLPTIFVCYHKPGEPEAPATLATANGRVWQRKLGESEDAFCKRVAEEAKPIRPDCASVVFLK